MDELIHYWSKIWFTLSVLQKIKRKAEGSVQFYNL